MFKPVNLLMVLLLATGCSAVYCAATEDVPQYEASPLERPAPKADQAAPRRPAPPTVLASAAPSPPAPAPGPAAPRHGGLKLSKVQSGVIDSDDFNDGVLNEHRWVKMQHREIFPTEEGGYLVIRGTPSENAKGWWHAGAMTTRGVSKGLPDVVMAVKYLLPNWDYACTMDWEEFPIYEAHLCNDTPDRNHSIRISRMCPGGAVKRALFGGLSEAQLPKQQINNSGVEMFVSYNDGKAQGFIVDKDGRVHPATKETAVELEDYKRMELKSVLAPRGVEVFLKVDWAVLYPQPRDVPAQVRVEGVPATAIKVQIGDWHKMASVAKGMATVQLPADKIYPAAASITVLNGEQVIGTLAIRRSKDLWGLYPGDTWKVSKR